MNTTLTFNNLIDPYLHAISIPRVEDFDKIVEQENKIADKFLLLKKDIGDDIYNQLTYKQKMFVVNVSGVINLGEAVNIGYIYHDIEKLEYE